MRFVEMVETVTILNVASGEVMQDMQPDGSSKDVEMSFKDWLGVMITDPKFGKDMSTVILATKISTKLDKANGWLALEDEQWKMLSDVVQSPTRGYDPRCAPSMVPYMEAVTEAETKEPEES